MELLARAFVSKLSKDAWTSSSPHISSFFSYRLKLNEFFGLDDQVKFVSQYTGYLLDVLWSGLVHLVNSRLFSVFGAVLSSAAGR